MKFRTEYHRDRPTGNPTFLTARYSRNTTASTTRTVILQTETLIKSWKGANIRVEFGTYPGNPVHRSLKLSTTTKIP